MGERTRATLALLLLLTLLHCAASRAQEEGDDDVFGKYGEVITIGPGGEERLIDRSGRGDISVRSDYSLDVYVIRSGSNRTLGDPMVLMCANSTECCFSARDVMVVLQNKHKDRPSQALYKNVSTCDGSPKGLFVVWFLVFIAGLTAALIAIGVCMVRTDKPFSVSGVRDFLSDRFNTWGNRLPTQGLSSADSEMGVDFDSLTESDRMHLRNQTGKRMIADDSDK